MNIPLRDIKKLVDYSYEEEAAHWEEEGGVDHIYHSLRRVSKWLSHQQEEGKDTDQ